MNLCPRCGLRFSDSSLISIRRECPNCGAHIPVPEPRRTGPGAIVTGYFEKLWRLLTRPSEFFRNLPAESGMGSALVFALVTHWVGSALEYLWKSALRGSIGREMDRLFQIAGEVADVDAPGTSLQLSQLRDHVSEWFWGASAVILDPFTTLLMILFTSLFVFAGAKLLIRPRPEAGPLRRVEVTFESAVQVVAYGTAPAILAGIPVFGGFIAWLCTVIITIIGAREVYRTTTPRAAVVALFPNLLLLAIILGGLFLAVIAVLKIFSAAF